MPRDKYEDEIRDILNRMDDFIPDDGTRNRPPPKRPKPSPWSGWSSRFRRKVYTFDSTSFMAAFIGLGLAAAVLSRIYGPLAAMVALASFSCLLIAILLPMFGRRYGRPEQRWRGRIIELDSYRPRQPFSWARVLWRIKRFFGLR